jgi:cell division protein FtsZ
MMKFDLPKENSSIIKVIGVGGGGSNAVNHMFNQGIKDVDFIVCNTDIQALDISPVPTKIQLGLTLTQGLGAGSLPDVGKNSAIESVENIKEILSKNTKMVFITAGMGGGTGTGAAPIIAAAAKELGILTVGIVTIPFSFEGKKRKGQAESGLEDLRQNVDTLIVINNDKLREMYGNLSLKTAFAQADNVLTTAAKGIAEVITITGYINVDFNDVSTVMKNGGTAIMGYAIAEGEDRAIKAVEQALSSPLLNDNNIQGASQVLLYITSGTKEVTMDEVGEISDYIQEEAGSSANIILGTGFDESLGENIRAIVIATGFTSKKDLGIELSSKPEPKKVFKLEDEIKASKVEATLEITETAVQEVFNEGANESNPENTIVSKTGSEEQSSIEFEVKTVPVAEQRVIHILDDVTDEISHADTSNEERFETELPSDDQRRKAQERIMRLKQLSFKNQGSKAISDYENVPAYKRRNVELDALPHSSESQISRYTLSEGEDKKAEIKPNNSFLHDNVD